MAIRHATVTAFTVEVSCPHCGEAIEEPTTGSQFWELQQVSAAWHAVDAGVRECNACERKFRIVPQSRVTVQ